jgi:hypothetical protein
LNENGRKLHRNSRLHESSSCFSNFKFDLDVNLRHHYPSPLPRYEHVGLHIGMMSLSDISVSLGTKFWPLCRAVYSNLQKNLADKQHLIYLPANRLTSTDELIDEQTKRSDGRINDLNFSNIGTYPFQREFEGMRLKHYYCVGADACPAVATNVLLVCSIDSLDYTLMHEAGEKNQAIARSWFDQMASLTDNAWQYGEEWTFDQFLTGNIQ